MDFNIWTEPRSVWDVAPVLLVCFYYSATEHCIAWPWGVFAGEEWEIVLA